MAHRRHQPSVPHRRPLLPAAPVLLILTFAACSAQSPFGQEPSRPSPVHDLDRVGRPGGFFDYPYPSDLRRDARGAPDLRAFPGRDDLPLLDDLAEAVVQDIRGFSPLGATYFRFTAPLDPRRLPRTPSESLQPESSVYLVDVDPRSPHRGERRPVHVRFRRAAGKMVPENTLIVRPLETHPLRGGTRYAVVVSRAVRGPARRWPKAHVGFTRLLHDVPPLGRLREWENLRDLSEWLGAPAQRARVLVATVFTTADHLGDLRRLRRWIHLHLPAPQAVAWRLVRQSIAFVLYEGRFPVRQFVRGTPPFHRPGEGVLRFQGDGAPIPGPTVGVRFALTVPRGVAPPGGWPLVTFASGSDGTYQNFVPVEAGWAARAGLAMLSMDHPLHGARNVGDKSFEDHVHALALVNPSAGRDLFRAGVPDHVQLVRLATETLAVPEPISHTGMRIRFQRGRLSFLGHSLGAQYGALLLAVEPRIRAAILSAAGGGLVSALLHRSVRGVPLQRLLATALGLDPATEPLDADHPVISLLVQTLFDPADPLIYAEGVIRRPAGPPPHVVMTSGLRDDQTHPGTTAMLAAAMGLPTLDRPTLLPPLRRNVRTGPYPVTGGLIRLPGHGHGALYSARHLEPMVVRWLADATHGAPPLPFR